MQKVVATKHIAASGHGIVNPEAANAAAVHHVLNQEQLKPLTKASPAVRFVPHYPGEPAAGYGYPGPDGKTVMPTAGLAARGAVGGVVPRPIPYYTDAHTSTSGHTGAPALTSILGSTAEPGQQEQLAKTYKENHPVGQAVIESLASVIPGVPTAKAIEHGNLGWGTAAAEAGNVLGLVGVDEITAPIRAIRAGIDAGKSATSIKDAIEAVRVPDSGFTLSPELHNAPPRGRFVVSYGAYETREGAPLKKKTLVAFRNQHLDALKADPSLQVGGWHNPEDGNVYLDLSKTFNNQDEAMQFAKKQGQLAIFDRENPTASISTGLHPEQADAIKAGHKTAADRAALLDQHAGTDLAGLPDGRRSNADAQRVATQYMKDSGIPYHPPTEHATVDPARQKAIADWYHGATSSPNDPAVRASYEAMTHETKAQYDAAVKAGYKFEFYPEHGDPYPGGPSQAIDDLRENKHLYVYPTDEGFGSEGKVTLNHPLLSDSGVKWGDRAVAHNDLFRAVHDFMGHFKEGVGFRADGEENAWRAHSAMYSDEARPAMTAETRGQNSWVNYGPYGEANQTAKQSETVYADQKAVTAPEWVVHSGSGSPVKSMAQQQHEASVFHDDPIINKIAEAHGLKSGDDIGSPHAGYVRLYRGEREGNKPGGEWFTTTKENASSYTRGPHYNFDSAKITYVDVPRDEASRFHDIGSGESAYKLPHEWASRARPISDESGQASLGAFLPERGGTGPYEERTIQHEGLTAQAQKPRSRVSKLGTRFFDRISAKLDKTVATDVPGARLLTTRERVAKLAGRQQRLEGSRRAAQHYRSLDTLGHIKEGSPEDAANYYYAQLPASHRNAEGLTLIKGQQEEELARIASGEAKRSIDKQVAAVKAKMSEADGSDKLPFLRDLEELKVERSDLPKRVEDITQSIGELEKLIAGPPAVNEDALAAIKNLSEDRKRIMVASGRLDPERAELREGLWARELGLEPDGTESYVGHRLADPEGFTGSYGHTGGTGRVASPRGVGSPNNLVLAKTGRLRPSTRVVAEDWQAAQKFEEAIQARDDIAKMGTPFTGRVPAGTFLVNPKGRTIPAAWKGDELERFGVDDNSVEEIRARAKEILDGFIGHDPETIERIKEDALANGVKWDELRVVPQRLVNRYYSQYKSSAAGVSTAGRAYDRMIDGVSASIVFGRLGYVPKNFVQNLIMAIPHQGIYLPINSVRAAQVIRDPELFRLIHGEIGFTGPTGALAQESTSQKTLGKIQSTVSMLADDPARISAFLHEATAEGVISHWTHGLLTPADRQKLINLLTKKQYRGRLNDIRSRSVEAMADFSRLTPDQSRMARRFFIIPGWLMAGSRYPFHFAATHPVRSALLAYAAAGEPGAPPSLSFNNPLTSYIKGKDYLRGIETPFGRERVNSLDPVSTPWQLGSSVAGSISGKKSPFDYSTPTVWDEAQPLVKAGYGVLSGEGVSKSLKPLVPNVGFVEGMIHPKPSSYYPGDATRVGRLEREVGIIPIPVDDVGTGSGKTKSALIHDAKAEGFGDVPKNILISLDHKETLDRISSGHPKDPNGRLNAAIAYYSKTTGDHGFDKMLKQKVPPAVAEQAYLTIRGLMIGEGLSAYEAAVKKAGTK